MIIKKIISSEDKAQMMVLESVVFAIIVIISLIFLYQLSPISTESTVYTSDLKIKGDSALQSLYNQEISAPPTNLPEGFPKSKLIYYLIADDYNRFILDLKNLLPPSTTYNIFISNGTKKVLWCNSNGDNTTPLGHTAQIVVISHYFISIHPQFFNGTKFGSTINALSDGSEMAKDFEAYQTGSYDIKTNYQTSTYDVILEMCIIGGK